MSGPIFRAALLLAYAAVVAWAFVDQSTEWPHVGSWDSLVFVLFCPGIVFQAVNLVFRWRKGRVLTRRWLVRLATIPAGLLLALMLTSWASALALSTFKRAYAPFVAEVGAHLTDPCPTATRAFDIPAVADYNRRTGSESPVGKLRYDKRRFVLSFGGGSIDMDGSTIFYDSQAKTWRQFHNDNHDTAYDRLVDGLAECSLHAEPR
jgi:hypothetical protein